MQSPQLWIWQQPGWPNFVWVDQSGRNLLSQTIQPGQTFNQISAQSQNVWYVTNGADLAFKFQRSDALLCRRPVIGLKGLTVVWLAQSLRCSNVLPNYVYQAKRQKRSWQIPTAQSNSRR